MPRWSACAALARVPTVVLLCLPLAVDSPAQSPATPTGAAGTGILVLQPGPEGKDATAYAISPTTNYGAAEWFRAIGLPSIGLGFLEFDLRDLPTDAVVTSAQLELWAEYRDGTLTFEPVQVAWDEMTLNWPNQPSVVWPALALTYPVSRGAPSGPCYWGCVQSFDVTSIVNAWANGTIANRGFRILGNTGSIGWMMATSDNLSYPRPRIWIQYDSDTPVATTTWGQIKSRYR